jgi:hypothetical protein
MHNLDIYYLMVPCTGLLMPLAGIGRSFRPDAVRHSAPAAPADAREMLRQTRLSMRWRMNSEGELVMEWTA